MTDDFITVSAGGPPPEADVPDGVYAVILTDIKDPRTVHVQNGKRAGQDMDLRDWVFAIDQPEHALDGRELDASTSLASGPKSKQFGYLTALNNGVPPLTGAKFSKADLIGRRALATIYHDDGGYPKIGNLGAMPAHMQTAGFGVQTGAPVTAAPPTPAAVPVAQQVQPAAAAPAGDDLPF